MAAATARDAGTPNPSHLCSRAKRSRSTRGPGRCCRGSDHVRMQERAGASCVRARSRPGARLYRRTWSVGGGPSRLHANRSSFPVRSSTRGPGRSTLGSDHIRVQEGASMSCVRARSRPGTRLYRRTSVVSEREVVQEPAPSRGVPSCLGT